MRTLVVGAGEASAAELSGLTLSAIEKQEATAKRTGTAVDFDALRERGGQMRREDVAAAKRNALLDRIKKHKQNPITDPPRQFQYYKRPAWFSAAGHKRSVFYDV